MLVKFIKYLSFQDKKEKKKERYIGKVYTVI